MTSIKDTLDIIQKTLTSAAIIAGGLWFFLRYEYMPKADISQSITTACFSQGVRWVRINILVENRGNARLVLGRHRVGVAAVQPVGNPDVESRKGKIGWPSLASLEIKPERVFLENNEHQQLYYDFFIPHKVTMIESSVWFENISASTTVDKVGWPDISLFSDMGGSCA